MPWAHATLTAALAVLVIAVAYGTQAPTLGVAEFAPAARSAPEAPPTTASPSALGGARPRRAATTTTAPPSTGAVDAATTASAGPGTTVATRGRTCFGEPPRQLPDPRSPACAPTVFEGENGGATTAGVTATEIRVAYTGDSTSYRPAITAVLDYANRHFELYGRRLVPVFVPPGAAGDVVSQRAVAAQIGEQDVFAAFEALDRRWYPAFFQELARQNVISVTLGAETMPSDRELLDESHPYLWSVYPSLEQMLANIGSFSCIELVGKPARHAGGALATKTRKFGVVTAGNYRLPRAQSLVDQLTGCGGEVVTAEWLHNFGDYSAGSAIFQKFKDAGVTTVVCVCADYSGTFGAPAAAKNGPRWEEPEWLLPLFDNPATDEYYGQLMFSPEQQKHLFGLMPHPKAMPGQTQWWMAAPRELGVPFTPDDWWTYVAYEQTLVLAAGIQAAGPNLNPDTFAQGLMQATFPNNGSGAAPYFQPAVGFGAGDHSFYDDYALAWYSPTAETYGFGAAERPFGSWCYLDRGRRFSTGTFPGDADGRFFSSSEPCR